MYGKISNMKKVGGKIKKMLTSLYGFVIIIPFSTLEERNNGETH